MANFNFESDVVALPQGAWSKTHRATLGWRSRDILAFTQGPFRPTSTHSTRRQAMPSPAKVRRITLTTARSGSGPITSTVGSR